MLSQLYKRLLRIIVSRKIGVGFVVKAKVGEIEKNIRVGRHNMMRKELLGCVQDVVGKKILLVQLEYGQKKDMSSCSLVFCV